MEEHLIIPSDTTSTPPVTHIAAGEPVAGRDTELTRRALYYTPPNSFAFALPAVPCHVFRAEREAAFNGAAATGLIPLDLSAAMGLGYPATTPLLLMRYARVRRGESLATRFKCGGEIYYVLEGSGQTRKGDTRIDWRRGDLFCLPGGGETIHSATEGSLLYAITNEPQFSFERAEAPAAGAAAVEAVLYPAEEVRRQWERLCVVRGHENIAGKAVLFTSGAMSRMRTCLPTISVGLNVFEPGDAQIPHRHNAVAVTLCLRAGASGYSRIDGQRVDWVEGAAMITPPTAAHSHHNEGKENMLALVVQDSGLYYYTRAVGFSFAT